jgi:hypothetical protein
MDSGELEKRPGTPTRSETKSVPIIDPSLVAIARHVSVFYQSLKKPLAFLLVVAAFLSQLVPLPAVQLAALVTLGLIIVEVLFDIRSNLGRNETVRVYSDFYEASNQIREEILSKLARKRHIRIRALGMSMDHAWRFLANTITPLLDDDTDQKIELDIAILDSRWDELPKINQSWAALAESNYMEILRYLRDNAKSLAAKGWEITVHRYSYMPNWHGILIDSDSLFMSTCFWKNGKLTGAENQYELLSSSDAELGIHRINQFITWFDFIKEQAMNRTTKVPSPSD